MVELRTLGALELLSADGTPLDSVLTQPRRTALLCYLALSSPRGFRRRDTLLALFWPEQDEGHARRGLRQSLHFLRRALGAAAIVSRGDDELALAPDQVRCDAADFERAADGGRLEAALALYRGELLPGFHVSDAPDFERWLDDERARLRRRAAEAAWALAEERERGGDPAAAAELGRRAAALSPGDETALRRLVLLLDRLGDRAAAVRAYDAFARDLERDYELQPSAESRALLARIRARKDDIEAPVPGSQREPRLAPPEEVSARTAEARQRLPPSRSRRRWHLVGAGLAPAALLALLGLGAWQLIARTHARPTTPTVRERVIVADFANLTSDTTLGELVAHVLRTELARSPALSVMGGDAVAGALTRMRREAGAPLSADLAREVAAREEVKLVVAGDVRAAGTGLVLTASVIEVATGDVIHGASEAARDSTEVLTAIERLGDSIRRGVGESIASVPVGDSLYSFTTSSLPALRKHMAATQAVWRGDYPRAVELLEEAVALDPDFAHAYLLLRVALHNMAAPRGRELRVLMRAYELRDRLTERERYAVEGHYLLNVTGDLPSAIAAFRKHIEALKQLPVGEAGWYSSLANALTLTGDLAAAKAVLEEARVRHPTPANLTALVNVQYALGEEREAHQVLEEISRRLPEHPQVVAAHVGWLADSGRYDEAHALAARMRRDVALPNRLRLLAELDAVRGRLDEAIGHLRELQDEEMGRGKLASALELAAAIGRLRLASTDSSGASEVDDLLARHPVKSLDVLSRPYLPLALFYAEAGRPRRARAWLDAYEREYPRQFRGPDRWMLHRVRAATLRAEGHPAEALAELLEAARHPAIRVGLFDDPSLRTGDRPELARAYDALGAPDSAIAVYERYLGVRSLSRMTTDAFELGAALERLGALYEAQGDRARAAAHSRRLAELWRDADVALKPRVEAARRRANE